MPIVSTLRDVANFFGVEPATVKRWRNRNPKMPGSPGKWDTDAIKSWYESNVDGRSASRKHNLTPDDVKEDMQAEDAGNKEPSATDRYRSAKAEREELRLQRERGDTVSRELVEQFFSMFFTELRTQSAKIPMELVIGYPAEFRDQLQEDIQERLGIMLRSMASWAEKAGEMAE